MVLPPLPQPAGADSSSMERVPPPILTTPGGMSLDLSRPPCPSQADVCDFNFPFLLQFKQREGHLRVPARHVEDGHKLGRWISMQRTHNRLGTLCPESLRRLNEIGFIWNRHEGKWNKMFKALTQFKHREGHLRVPQLHVEDGQHLGAWIGSQRCQKRLGTLISERERRLNEIGFIWKAREAQSVKRAPGGMRLNLSPPRPSKAGPWDFNFLLLLQFRDREGHMSVPKHHVEDGKRLGVWIRKQRAKQKAGTLFSEWERRLTEIGLIWGAHEARWGTMFRNLTQFKQREGHMKVSRYHVENGQNLGNWIRMQRAQKRSGTLFPGEERQLKEIGFIWTAVEAKWETMFRALTQFKEREGHLRVPSQHVEDGQHLGAWISKQRAEQKAGTLVSEWGRRLNEIGLIWGAHEARWGTMFRALTQFKQREGHLRVSRYHVENGHHLGDWISIQRAQKRTGTLFPEEERQLKEIGFIWTAFEAKWETMFRALTRFKEREGHLRVPVLHVEDGQHLGGWIGRHRLEKRKGLLCPEEERRLNEIGFIWNEPKEKLVAMITALAQFKQREGHCNVSTNHTEHLDDWVNLKLGSWLRNQRYRQRCGKMDAEREKQLESLGVKWHSQRQEISFDQNFDWNFDMLLVFKEREGHVRVPFDHQESAADNLGAWLAAQWSLYRIGALELDRQTRLEVAGVTWEYWVG
jgi:hypothetical protein